MAYPEKVTDLNPDQLVSRPVVYDLLPGLSAKAQAPLLKAISVFESFSASPLPREQIVAYRRPLTTSEADKAQDRLSKINGRADKTPIASDPGCLR